MLDHQYSENLSEVQESKHHYPPNIHLIGNSYTHTLLGLIGASETKQPHLNLYVEWCYLYLLQAAMNKIFPKKIQTKTTRMEEHHPGHGMVQFQGFNEDHPIVVIDIARAGSWPSQTCYQHLNYFFPPDNIRQDHIYINRKTDASGQVVGQTLAGSKIGGSINHAILIFPDPMGASGGTIDAAIKHYQESASGTPHSMIALHLMITPEYIERMKKDFPKVEIFALRLDRGLSSERALQALPGKFPAEEKGLNNFQYVVPGAGGVGEILNNSFV
ncbi:MAG: uracil phosphoribosyltransferase [Bacteriovoracaceae bacterium]|nr:uracil phosphoribosyltransferase [Bacteriovoracaceae bacterium]